MYSIVILHLPLLACMCDPRGSENEICDFDSGQCTCLPFVAGRTCSQCEAGYYNLTSGLGCQQCTCGAGATDVQCDMMTGECGCQVGVSGPTCDECLPQYFNFTPAGCRWVVVGCKQCGAQANHLQLQFVQSDY